MQASQWESERAALRQQNRALALKAESGHKTVIILIIGIAALLTVVVALWSIVKRRQRERENEERIDVCRKWWMIIKQLLLYPILKLRIRRLSAVSCSSI